MTTTHLWKRIWSSEMTMMTLTMTPMMAMLMMRKKTTSPMTMMLPNPFIPRRESMLLYGDGWGLPLAIRAQQTLRLVRPLT